MARHAHRLQRRIPGVVVAVGCVTLTGVASAAALNGLSSSLLGSGAAPVAVCDPDGFVLTHVLSGSDVTDVTVGDIHADCAGGDVSLTLTDGAGAEVSSGGPVTVPGGGGNVTVDVSPDTDVSTFSNHHVRIVGP